MYKASFIVLLAISALSSALVSANDNIAINLSISGEIAPGVYGRVNIGDKHPVLLYEQPLIVKTPPHKTEVIYLHVPPGHAKHWDKHCVEYQACDHPVYFIKSHEYDEDYDRKKRDKHKDRDRGEHGQSHSRD